MIQTVTEQPIVSRLLKKDALGMLQTYYATLRFAVFSRLPLPVPDTRS